MHPYLYVKFSVYTDDLLLDLQICQRFTTIAVTSVVASTKLDPATLTSNFYSHLDSLSLRLRKSRKGSIDLLN